MVTPPLVAVDAPRRVQLTLGRFRSSLNVAMRRRLVVRNVAQYTQIPYEARRKAAAAAAQRVPWSETEVRQFLASIRDHRLHARPCSWR